MSGAEPLIIASAATSLYSGLQARGAARSDARAAEYQARALATQADQQSAYHRRSLNEALSSIDAIRGSRNVSGRGSTTQAISREQRRRSAFNENSEVLSTRYGIVNANTKAASSRARGNAALVGSVGRTLGSLGSYYGSQ